MTKEEELLMENYYLKRVKGDFENIIEEKDKEIGHLKAQVEKFQELMKESKEQRGSSPI